DDAHVGTERGGNADAGQTREAFAEQLQRVRLLFGEPLRLAEVVFLDGWVPTRDRAGNPTAGLPLSEGFDLRGGVLRPGGNRRAQILLTHEGSVLAWLIGFLLNYEISEVDVGDVGVAGI